MSTSQKLTDKQQAVFDFILDSIHEKGFPPTRAEITVHCGFQSVTATEDHLQALVKKDAIEIIPNISRGIRVLKTTHRLATETEKKLSDGIPLFIPKNKSFFHDDNIKERKIIDPHLFSEIPDFLFEAKHVNERVLGIQPTDLLAFQIQKNIKSGQYVLVQIDDTLVLRQFHKTGQIIELTSELVNVQPIKVLKNKTYFIILGTLIGLIRSFNN